MGILLIILGAIGWIISANNLLVIPTVLYVGCMVVGAVIVLIQVGVYLKTAHTVKKTFDMFD